jgi:hypothetical protein
MKYRLEILIKKAGAKRKTGQIINCPVSLMAHAWILDFRKIIRKYLPG